MMEEGRFMLEGEVHVRGGGSCWRREVHIDGGEVHVGRGRLMLKEGKVYGGKFMMEEGRFMLEG